MQRGVKPLKDARLSSNSIIPAKVIKDAQKGVEVEEGSVIVDGMAGGYSWVSDTASLRNIAKAAIEDINDIRDDLDPFRFEYVAFAETAVVQGYKHHLGVCASLLNKSSCFEVTVWEPLMNAPIKLLGVSHHILEATSASDFPTYTRPPHKEQPRKQRTRSSSFIELETKNTLPRSFHTLEDTHCAHLMSQVSQQGPCGSCYALAPLDVTRDVICLKQEKTVELSIADALGCSPGKLGPLKSSSSGLHYGYGCSGGPSWTFASFGVEEGFVRKGPYLNEDEMTHAAETMHNHFQREFTGSGSDESVCIYHNVADSIQFVTKNEKRFYMMPQQRQILPRRFCEVQFATDSPIQAFELPKTELGILQEQVGREPRIDSDAICAIKRSHESFDMHCLSPRGAQKTISYTTHLPHKICSCKLLDNPTGHSFYPYDQRRCQFDVVHPGAVACENRVERFIMRGPKSSHRLNLCHCNETTRRGYDNIQDMRITGESSMNECKRAFIDQSDLIFLKSTQYIHGELQMINALHQHGPLVAHMSTNRAFMEYQGGVFSPSGFDSQFGNFHSVVILGYGEEDGVPFWHCRNTWGSEWGEGGFFRISRGKNVFGIEILSVALEVNELDPARGKCFVTPPIDGDIFSQEKRCGKTTWQHDGSCTVTNICQVSDANSERRFELLNQPVATTGSQIHWKKSRILRPGEAQTFSGFGRCCVVHEFLDSG